MKWITLIVGTLLFSNEIIGQLPLPKVTTTKQIALTSLSKNIDNEDWFFQNEPKGGSFQAFFRNTPVGLKHAFDKFNQLKISYGSNDCDEKSLFSRNDKKEDGSIDYQMLSASLKLGSSEIVEQCQVKDKKITFFNIGSTESEEPYIVITVFVR